MKTTSSTPSRRIPIGFAFYSFALTGMGGGANGVLIPSMSAFYHVGDALIGLLFVVSSFAYFLSALSCGFLIERLGLRPVLLFGTMTLLLGTLGFVLQLPFAVLLPARLIAGFGIGIIETALNVFITALPRNAALLNNLHAFFGVGSLLGPLLGGAVLALSWGWSSVYLMMLALYLPMLIGFSIYFDPKRSTESAHKTEQPVNEDIHAPLWTSPQLWLATLFLLVYVGVEVSLGNWSYSFLLETRQQGTLLAGWIVSGYWFGLTFGRFTLQALAERFGLKTIGLMYLSMGIAAGGLLLAWLLPDGIMAALGLFLIGYGLGPIYPLTVSIIPRLVAARFTARAIGILVSVSIIGLAIFPWAAGILAQFSGIWTLMPYMLALVLLMIALWYGVARFLATQGAAPPESDAA